MLKRTRILSYLLIVLLAIIGNSDAKQGSAFFSHHKLVFTGHSALGDSAAGAIKRPSLYQQKIKIRYMGGDCKYNAAPAFSLHPPLPTDEVKKGYYRFHFYSRYSFSSRLRGPPIV